MSMSDVRSQDAESKEMFRKENGMVAGQSGIGANLEELPKTNLRTAQATK